MAMNYHLVSLSSDIVEDDFNDGEGNSTGCGYQHEPVGKSFSSLETMIAYLASIYGLPGKLVDYAIEGTQLHTSKTVANHSEAQNGGWFEATTSELAAWSKGKMKLYSENYSIRFIRCA